MALFVEWAVANRLVLVAGFFCTCFIISVYLREKSWSNYVRLKEADILRLETELDTALYRIQLEISGNPSCERFNNTVYAPVRETAAIIAAEIQGNVALLDYTGLIQVLLASISKIFEIELFHNHISREEFVFRFFLSWWTPATTLAVFTAFWLAGCAAWLGILPRHEFSHSAIKFIICYIIAIPISQVITNFIRIRRYLPTSREMWLKQLHTLSWWGWLLSKLFNLDKLEKALTNLMAIIFCLWMIWPYRYYFYFCRTCRASAASTDLFLTNMLLHSCFTLMWISSLQMMLSGSPAWIRNPNSFMRRWMPLFWVAPKGGLPVLWIIVLGVSTLICVLRILWFVWLGGCTWWGAMITWMFCHLHIAIVISNVALFSVSITRETFIRTEEPEYVDKFLAEHKRRRADEAKNSASDNVNGSGDSSDDGIAGSAEISAEEEADVRSLASGIFHALLDKAVRSYVLDNGKISYYNMKDRAAQQDAGREANGGKKEVEENEQSKDGDSAGYQDFKFAFQCAQFEFLEAISLRYEDVAKQLAMEKKKARTMTKKCANNIGKDGISQDEGDELNTKDDIDVSLEEVDVTPREVFSKILGADVLCF